MKAGRSTRSMTLGLCLLAIILSQFVAACGGNSSSNNGPVDLTLWAYPAAPEVGAPPNNWFLIQTVKQKLNINLHVTLTPVGDDGDTKMSAAAAANNMPDLFQVPTNTNLFLQWVKLGLISPVDDLYSQMPNRTKAQQYNDPVLKKIATINGKTYILQGKAGLTKRQGLFIRKDWLDKLGLPMPKTLDDLMNVAKAFTFNDPDGDGKNDTYGFGAMTANANTGLDAHFAAILGAFGLSPTWNFNTKGKVSLSVRDPNYMKAIAFIKQMQDAKVIDPDWTTLSTNDFRARWKQGKYGIFSEDFCAGECQANYTQFDTNYPDANLVPLNPPTGPSGQSLLGDYNTLGTRLAVSQKAMDAGKGAAIAKLLEWMNTDGYYLTSFGQEGQNYKLDAQGNVTKAGVPVPFDGHAAAPINQLRNLGYKNTPAELKARYPAFQTKNGRTLDPIQVYNAFAAMPWHDITATYAIQPASNQVDINSYIDQGLVQFMTGQKELTTANWNAFISGMSNLNVADWEAAANKTLKDDGLL